MSGVVDKVKAKVDQVLHKDNTNDPTHGTHDTTGHHTTGHGTTGGVTGHDTTTGGLGHSTTAGHNTTSGGLTGRSDPTGPHDSHLGNKADPRVDSDRYGTSGNTAGAGGYGTGQYGEHTTGHSTTGHGTTGTAGGYGTTGRSDPTGPHDSKLANKLDPRVDSDQYGTAGNTAGAGGHGTGQYGSTTGHGTTGHHTTGQAGGLTGALAGQPYASDGPHNTHTANVLDPHVSSGSGAGQYGAGHHTTGTGAGLTGHSTTGGYGTTGRSDPTGPHDSHLGNKADPRVDSDRYGTAGNTAGAGGYGTGQYGEGHHTTGTGAGLTGHSTTGHGTTGGYGTTGRSDPTGPHDSHLGNKADPRVDSDRYGTAGNTTGAGGIGGGQYTEGHHGTHGTHGTTGHHTTGGVGGTSGEYGSTGGSTTLKEGELPKALTEDRSKAVPHSAINENRHEHGHEHGHDNKHGSEHADEHSAGHHNTNTKPSLMDKLNPKKDTDGDGKAGIMD